MTQIERIRKSKPVSKWVSWIWLGGAGLWFAAVVMNSSRSGLGLAVVQACAFMMFLFAAYVHHRKRLDKELVAEIDRLQQQLELYQSEDNQSRV